MRDQSGRFSKGHSFGEITRFTAGNNLSPGRPKKKPIRDALRRLLNEMQRNGLTNAEHLAQVAFLNAISGDENSIHWARFIQQTTEGKLDEVVEEDEPEPKPPEAEQPAPDETVIDVTPEPKPAGLPKPQGRKKPGKFNAWLKQVSPDRDWDAPHLLLLQEKIEAVNRGEIKRLIVSMPPRHGKSELLSIHAPVWFLNENPRREIIAASWGINLSRKFTRKSRQLAERVGISLSKKVAQAGQWETEAGGIVFAVGVRGGVAGFGADILICDDPVKDIEEAQSPLQRERVWDWFTSEALTRLSPNGACILIMTRRHESDLIGSLVEGRDAETGEQAEEQDLSTRWEYISLPAISEGAGDILGRPEGEPLWPTRFSVAWLNEKRRSIGEWIYAALYQQRPAPRSGGLFHKDWFSQFVYEMPSGKDIRWVRYWDKGSTEGGGDPTCGVLIAATPDGKFIVCDVLEAQVTPAKRRALQKQCAETDPPGTVIWIEHEGGSSGVDAAEAEARELAGYSVHWEHPTGSKTVRAEPFASQCEAGNVALLKAAWNRKFIEQHCSFPNAKNDDIVDAAGGAFRKLAKPRKIRVI